MGLVYGDPGLLEEGILTPLRITVPAALATAALLAAPANAASGKTIRLKDDLFSPRSSTVSKGATVTFRWAGQSPHDLRVKRGSKTVLKAGIRVSGSVKQKFKSAGTYTLICTVHEDMTGTLRVR